MPSDIRIKDLPIIPFIVGGESLPLDDSTNGTTRSDLNGLLSWIVGSLPPATPTTELVYRPGGPSVGNVFGSFLVLFFTALSLPAGAPFRIYLDGSFTGGIVNIPAGPWNFISDYEIVGVTGPVTGVPTMQLADGCNFLRWPSTIRNVVVDDQNTILAAFRAQGFGAQCVTRLVDVVHQTSAGLPLLYTSTAGTDPKVYLYRSTVVGAPLVSSLAARLGLDIWVSGGSVVGHDVLECTPGGLVLTVDASSKGSIQQAAAGAGEFRTEWSSQSTFVYRTSVPPYAANEFDDWADLVSAVNSVSGFITIVFPESITIPQNVQYDADTQRVRWLGGGNTGGGGLRPKVTGAPDTQVFGVSVVENLTILVPDDTVPGGGYFHGPSGAAEWSMAWVNANGEAAGATKSVVLNDNGGLCELKMFQNSSFYFSGGAPAVTGTGPGSIVFNMYDAASLDADMVAADAAHNVTFRQLSPATGIGPQALIFNPPTYFIGARDEVMQHTLGADAGAWVAPPPATVQAAIARLALAVQGLLGAPIP